MYRVILIPDLSVEFISTLNCAETSTNNMFYIEIQSRQRAVDCKTKEKVSHEANNYQLDNNIYNKLISMHIIFE
jgi:hypothetical protein